MSIDLREQLKRIKALMIFKSLKMKTLNIVFLLVQKVKRNVSLIKYFVLTGIGKSLVY